MAGHDLVVLEDLSVVPHLRTLRPELRFGPGGFGRAAEQIHRRVELRHAPWNVDGAEINTVDGFAPDAVTVEVDAPDLLTSTATVVNGRYIVWLPKAVDVDQDDLGIEIRYIDETGRTAQTIEL